MNAKSQNPYEERGEKFLESYLLVLDDYNDGKIKEINEETLREYSDRVPVDNKVNLDIANQVVEKVKNSSIENEVEKSSLLSSFSKSIFLQSTVNEANFEELTDQVLNRELPENEKELVLTKIAISKNLVNYSNRNSTNSSGCTVNGKPAPCGAVGAGIGLLAGTLICGPLCGVGGAIIGGIIGSSGKD